MAKKKMGGLGKGLDSLFADLFWPHRNGLQKPVLGDAVGQLVQRVVVKPLAGLLGVRLDFPQRQR